MTIPTGGGPRPDALARARALLDDVETRLDASFRWSELPADVDRASVELAAVDKLLDPGLCSLGLLTVGSVFETGRTVAAARAAALVIDPSLPRIVRARLARVVGIHSDEEWDQLLDGPLLDEEDADCLPLEGEFEAELSLLALGARSPDELADTLGECHPDWEESLEPRFEAVRRDLGVPASQAYAAVVRRPELDWLHEVAAEALADEGTEEAAGVLSSALDEGAPDEDGVLRAAWESIRIRRAEGSVPAPPLQGECRLQRMSPGGTLIGYVTVGTGRLLRRVFLATIGYSDLGLDVKYVREVPTERVAPVCAQALGEHLVVPLGEGLLAMALAGGVQLQSDTVADRLAFEALLHRAPELREIPDGEAFEDADEIRDLVTIGALAGWTLSERDLLNSRRMAAFIAEGRPAGVDEDGDPEAEFLELCVRFGRRVQHAALEARWTGNEALCARLWASGERLRDGDPSVLMLLVARQLGVDALQ